METLINKKYDHYDYLSRYESSPVYYDTLNDRNMPGISSNVYKNIPFITYSVKVGDTLDSLALKYYNNPSFWWVIAYFNDIQDAFINLKDRYSTLKIPNISAVSFGNERVY